METTRDSLMAYCSHNIVDAKYFTSTPEGILGELPKAFDDVGICGEMRGKLMAAVGSQPNFSSGVRIEFHDEQCGRIVLYISYLNSIAHGRIMDMEKEAKGKGSWRRAS